MVAVRFPESQRYLNYEAARELPLIFVTGTLGATLFTDEAAAVRFLNSKAAKAAWKKVNAAYTAKDFEVVTVAV